ncbi:MAG: hypothetical protein C0179_07780 [Fervidicoccus sp.]|nr:MAG: hypothetical protein C0179_07780 [Fervidicoccus sp.]
MYFRELGVSGRDNEGFMRKVVTEISVEDFFRGDAGAWRRRNWYLSNAFSLVGDWDPDSVYFDRLSIDLDSPGDKSQAIKEALRFAEEIEGVYGARPLVVDTGFKGAHIHVFLSNCINWGDYQLLYKHMISYISNKGLVDKNMLQWNRLVRVPFTRNIKGGEARDTRIIYPTIINMEDFDWRIVSALDLSKVQVVRVVMPEIPKTIVIRKPRGSWGWAERVVETGLPDGRKRFILEVLSPYLINVKNLSVEEALEEIKRFIENSCKNHNNCGKIYESWIKSDLERVRGKRLTSRSLSSLREKDPDLYKVISEVLNYGKPV